MNILLGVDGTEKSWDAIRFVSPLLKPGRDRILLFFAPPRQSWSSLLTVTREQQQATLASFAESVFSEAEAQVPEGLTCERLTPDAAQSTSRSLIDAARQSNSDMIVVGAGHASSRLPFIVTGVARSVLHEADRPVLACRYRPTADRDSTFNVLVAIDPAISTSKCIELLHQFNWPIGSRGRLIHVMDYVEDERLRHWINESGDPDSIAWSHALDQKLHEERARIRTHMSEVQRRFPAVFGHDEPILTMGHVVEQILRTAASESIDMIVVGGRQRGPVARLLGSTTEGLLLQANMSILVVHEESDS